MGELDGAIRGMTERGIAALGVLANHILGEAQREAPIEESTLRGSGNVEIHVTANGAEAVIGFDTPYAARQHEETTWNHPIGGKSKFLEDPLKRNAGRVERDLAAAIGKGI